MSVSGVSANSTSNFYQTSNPTKDARNAFKTMADAIRSGDLQGAQNAYASLAQLLDAGQQSSSANGSGTGSGSGTDIQSLLNQIGGALQSGDISGAQQLLQSRQQTAQAQGAHGHHRHHHAGGVGDPDQLQAAQGTTGGATSASTSDSLGTTGGVNLTV